MKIIDIKPKGFCKGVMRAIILAKKTRLENPTTPITILGAIVHNKYITSALKLLNIQTVETKGKSRLELLDEIAEGIVILSAHGSSQQVKDKALAKGLTVVDASCEDVISTHEVIREALSNQKQVIYIGKNKHPESEAVIQNFPQVQFIESVKDLDQLTIDKTKPCIITNQTTLSLLEIKDIVFEISKQYSFAEFINEICAATRVRQEAILNTEGLDVLIVVGDPNSNNTNMLAKIGKENGVNRVIQVECLQQLDLALLHEQDCVGVTAGASTPRYLTQMILDYLKELRLDSPDPFPPIQLEHLLD